MFTTIRKQPSGEYTVAYELDAHSSGSKMFLVFTELSFDLHDEANAARILLETEFRAHGHAAFGPHDTQVVTVMPTAR